MHKTLYKIEQQVDKYLDGTVQVTPFYTVKCYLYSKNSHRNEELWSIRNLDKEGVACYLQGKDNKQPGDTEFAFAIVNSGNGPAILTSQGNLLAAPVRIPVKVKKNVTRILPKFKNPKFKARKEGQGYSE